MGIKFDMSEITKAIPELKQIVEQAQLDVTQKLTLDVYRNVVVASPVDTGEFRGDWKVETPQTPGQDGEVYNTKPYGPQLANGRSKQAPPGWIDNAIEAAIRHGGK
jgi:hypothetical protein